MFDGQEETNEEIGWRARNRYTGGMSRYGARCRLARAIVNPLTIKPVKTARRRGVPLLCAVLQGF
jgi:hypothetical protein